MHVIFDPDEADWQQFLSANTGAQMGWGFATYQVGRGGGGGGYFEGMPYQRGHGIGSVFRSLMRFLLPLGKQAAASIGREGLETTSRVLNSILASGNDSGSLKQTLKREAATGAANLFSKASDHLLQQQGQGRRQRVKAIKGTAVGATGKPYKPLYTRVSPREGSVGGKHKRTRRDILGTY